MQKLVQAAVQTARGKLEKAKGKLLEAKNEDASRRAWYLGNVIAGLEALATIVPGEALEFKTLGSTEGVEVQEWHMTVPKEIQEWLKLLKDGQYEKAVRASRAHVPSDIDLAIAGREEETWGSVQPLRRERARGAGQLSSTKKKAVLDTVRSIADNLSEAAHVPGLGEVPVGTAGSERWA